MDNNVSSSHRIHNHLAVVDTEVPDFMGIKNGIYLSSINDSKNKGNVIFFEDGVLKTKNRQGITTTFPNKIFVSEQNISIGSSLLSNKTSRGTVIIGNDSGKCLSDGCDNILIGRNVSTSMTEGNDIIAIGPNTLKDSSPIGGSIAIGAGAMGDCEKTEMNIAIGNDSLKHINDSYNIAIGVEAGKDLRSTLTNHNICIGKESMSSSAESSIVNAINIISLGTQTCANISGNNFQSIYIGDGTAQYLKSDVISVNNIGIGSKALSESSNISDIVCIGPASGTKISGIRSIIIGSNTANNIEGNLNGDIIIGNEAGSSRNYKNSYNVFIGNEAGYTGSGVEIIGIGKNSAKSLHGNYNISIGSRSGEHLLGEENICLGTVAGASARGNYNIFIGPKSGYALEGSKNVWIGEGPTISDILERSVVIGSQISVKGVESIAIGSQAGKYSTGYLNRDILIGTNAGKGQKYSETLVENGGFLLIGTNAGLGCPENPENINSSELVCIGHSAGHSNEQSFKKTVFIGNYAGSYAVEALECIALGHSAGVGMSGKYNIFVGSNSGFNVKGSKNILIGSHCGDQAGEIETELNNVLAIGNSNRPTILGNLEKGNLIIGSTLTKLPEWTDGKGTIGFTSTERPSNVSSGISGVLYGFGKHLEYTTHDRTTNLTFPYKIISQGEINGIVYSLDIGVDGGTLLIFKIAPFVKADLLLNEEIMLNVIDKKCSIMRKKDYNKNWSFEIINGNTLKLSCIENLNGICYLEAVGVHVLKADR